MGDRVGRWSEGVGQAGGWSGEWVVGCLGRLLDGQVAGGLLGGCVMAGLIGYIEHLNLVGVDVGVKLGKFVEPSEVRPSPLPLKKVHTRLHPLHVLTSSLET